MEQQEQLKEHMRQAQQVVTEQPQQVQAQKSKQIIQCDECKKDITGRIELKAKHVVGDIKKHYFDCPYCGKRYTCYFTNSHMRALIKKPSTPEIKQKLLFEANAIENILRVKVKDGEVNRIEDNAK